MTTKARMQAERWVRARPRGERAIDCRYDGVRWHVKLILESGALSLTSTSPDFHAAMSAVVAKRMKIDADRKREGLTTLGPMKKNRRTSRRARRTSRRAR